MSQTPSDPQYAPDDESQKKIADMSLVEIGEKLFQWRDYVAIPIFMVLLLAGHPTARSATIGTLMIVLGVVMRVYTVSFLSENGDQRDSQLDGIVTVGPYAIIRNPLYAANMMVITGVIVYLSSIVFGLMALGFFVFQYHCIAKYEESILLAKFGSEFQRYYDRVPAWMPMRLPSVEDFPPPLNLRQALASERRMFAVIGIIFFLLLLSGK